MLTLCSWGCLTGIKTEKVHPAEVQAAADSIEWIMQAWIAALHLINVSNQGYGCFFGTVCHAVHTHASVITHKFMTYRLSLC